MANVKISGLPAASTPLTGAELVPIVQSGVTSQTTASEFGAAVGSTVTYMPAGTGAVETTVQAKLRETVSVKDFGAVCDGLTDDWQAIQDAQEYLKANGGGTLYFPGWCLINQPFYFYGSVTNGWINNPAYPNPQQPQITWRSNTQGGIRVGSMTSGDVLRFSRPSDSSNLYYTVGFRDFCIDCVQKNVTAINAFHYSGVGGANHYTDIDNLVIQGIQGANAIGFDTGTITDCKVRGLLVQGYGSGPYAGIRLNKTDVQLIDCRFIYCKYGIVVGTLSEACIQMFGGSVQSPKTACIYWEGNGTTTVQHNSASVITGAFLGETNYTVPDLTEGPTMAAQAPAYLDVGSVTFVGCTFDNWTASTSMIYLDYAGKFTFIGCNAWYNATGVKTVKVGSLASATFTNNNVITLDATSAAIALGNVTYPVAYEKNATFTPVFSATGSTFSYSTQKGYYTKVGNVVTATIRIQLAASGNTLTANDLTITGLPYTSANNTYQNVIFPVSWHVLGTALVNCCGEIQANTSSIILLKVTAATTTFLTQKLQASDLANQSLLEMTFSYYASN